MRKVRLVVPASTSNLGPGFDTLGLALDWPLTAEASSGGSGVSVSLDYSGPAEWEGPMKELVLESVRQWEHASGKSAEGLSLSIRGDVPIARGLGSSAVYRTAAAGAADALFGSPLGKEGVLELVCRLEGHTDNAVPCVYGGLTASGRQGGKVRFVRYPVPERLRFVVLVPVKELATSEARAVLPQAVPREDAVFSIQRSLWLVEALAGDRPEEMGGVFEDRLHQPYREKLVPFLPRVIAAAEGAGAYGAFLSGAGSCIVAVTDESHAPAVIEAMENALSEAGGRGQARTLRADNRGMRLEELP